MKFANLFLTCLRALVRNPMRAALTILGIVVGIAAVVAIREIGEGSKQQIAQRIASMGANTVTVSGASVRTAGVSSGMGGRASLLATDAQALMDECSEYVTAASPVVRANGQVIVGNTNWSPNSITGGNEHYLKIEGWEVVKGSAFTKAQVEDSARVCLIGQTIATLFLNIDFLGVGVFQACGMGRLSLIFAILRKIVLEIPALFVLNKIWPMYGLAYAGVVSEVVLSTVAIIQLKKILNEK